MKVSVVLFTLCVSALALPIFPGLLPKRNDIKLRSEWELVGNGFGY